MHTGLKRILRAGEKASVLLALAVGPHARHAILLLCALVDQIARRQKTLGRLLIIKSRSRI